MATAENEGGVLNEATRGMRVRNNFIRIPMERALVRLFWL